VSTELLLRNGNNNNNNRYRGFKKYNNKEAFQNAQIKTVTKARAVTTPEQSGMKKTLGGDANTARWL